MASSQLINDRFLFDNINETSYYDYIQKYVERVSQQYYRHWVWFDRNEEMVDGLNRVYTYIRNDCLIGYVGKTHETCTGRLRHVKYDCSQEILSVVADEKFACIVWGYIDESTIEDPNDIDHILAIFEHIFIHIMSQLLHDCTNRFKPKLAVSSFLKNN